MQVFHTGVINDNRSPASDRACGVEVLVGAESRADAIAELRMRGFTSVHSRDVKELERAHVPRDGVPMPGVALGQVWARAVYVAGAWEQR